MGKKKRRRIKKPEPDSSDEDGELTSRQSSFDSAQLFSHSSENKPLKKQTLLGH